MLFQFKSFLKKGWLHSAGKLKQKLNPHMQKRVKVILLTSVKQNHLYLLRSMHMSLQSQLTATKCIFNEKKMK